MYRSILTALALATAAGCASQLETSAAHHQANAVALDAAGDRDGALREREAADRAREQLAPWTAARDRDVVPPLTAF